MPQSGSAGSGGSGRGGGLEEDFNKSLGDFDGQMEGERSGMASSGEGSAREAEQREAGDAASVGGGMKPVAGSAGGAAGGMASLPPSGSKTDSPGADGAAAGGEAGEAGESDIEATESPSGQAAKVPDDIPLDTNAEDQVAKQIREAAMAEEDPVIRDALWDEYRKHQGIK